MISTVIERVSSNPTHSGPWNHPCRGKTPIRQPLLVTPSPEPETDEIVAQKLSIQCQEIVLLANMTRFEYFSERIQSSELRHNLDVSFPLVGFPFTTIIPASTIFVEHLKEDYRRASIVAVFLEQLREDEEASTSYRFDTAFTVLEAKVYSLLCQIYDTLQDRTALNIPHVSRHIMSLNDRNVQSVAERFSRDYKVLKDTVHLFRAMGLGYNGSTTT